MKKILCFFLIFLSLKSFAQYPNGKQTLGSDSNVIEPKGGFHGRVINWRYADTASANLQRISQYPGAQISVGNSIYVRDSTATAWILQGGGTTLSTFDTTTIYQNIQNVYNYFSDTSFTNQFFPRGDGVLLDTVIRITDSTLRFIYTDGTQKDDTFRIALTQENITNITNIINYIDSLRGNDTTFILSASNLQSGLKALYSTTDSLSGNDTLHLEFPHNNPSEDSVLTTDVDGDLKMKLVTSGSGGVTNTGAGYRLVTGDGALVKSVNTDLTQTIDSTSNLNQLTWKVDTSQIATQYDLTAYDSAVFDSYVTPDSLYLVLRRKNGTLDSTTFVSTHQPVTLTTIGTSGAATIDPTTQVLNIPIYTTDISGKLNISDTASMLNPYKNKVDTIYRTPGKDSIQYTISGRYHAIRDSTGGGGGGAADSSLFWSLSGNSGATPWIGLKTNNSFRVRTNNIQRMLIDSVGKTTITGGGTTTAATLTVQNVTPTNNFNIIDNGLVNTVGWINIINGTGITFNNSFQTGNAAGMASIRGTDSYLNFYDGRNGNSAITGIRGVYISMNAANNISLPYAVAGEANLFNVDRFQATKQIVLGYSASGGTAMTSGVLTSAERAQGAGGPSLLASSVLNLQAGAGTGNNTSGGDIRFYTPDTTSTQTTTQAYTRKATLFKTGAFYVGNTNDSTENPQVMAKFASTTRGLMLPIVDSARRDGMLYVSSVAITNAGTGYSTPAATTVTVSSGGTPITAAGVTVLTLSGGTISTISFTPGYGYTSAPTFTVGGTGTGAVLTPTMSGLTTGLSIFCSDCHAVDGSVGVNQTYNGTNWKSWW